VRGPTLLAVSDHKLVELVDPTGAPVGSCPVTEAHTPPGQLHRAFSVLLFDVAGRVLLQRRALTKNRFAGRWANTCCSHPAPGEDVIESACRRLHEELGLRVEAGALRERGRFTYRAADPGSDTVEHEFDHVLVGRHDADPVPLESEVHAWRWVAPEQLRTELAAAPDLHAPWLEGVLRIALGDE
jgi:isopentenyl-diphosphate Delta-isomerase